MDNPVSTPRSKMHPVMIMAGIAVTLLSTVGIAAMMGWLPAANSSSAQSVGVADQASAKSSTHKPASSSASAPVSTMLASNRIADTCRECGIIEAINAVDVKGQGSGAGAVIGGVLGGVLGHQVGGGRGKDVATVAGAVGGAFAGNEVEKSRNSSVRYQVRVRLDDGTLRTVSMASVSGYQNGDRVRLDGTALARI